MHVRCSTVRQAGLPHAPDLLRRLHRTPPLGALGAAERAAVLEGVFAVSRRGAAHIAGRRVLVVEDTSTTGGSALAIADVASLAP